MVLEEEEELVADPVVMGKELGTAEEGRWEGEGGSVKLIPCRIDRKGGNHHTLNVGGVPFIYS